MIWFPPVLTPSSVNLSWPTLKPASLHGRHGPSQTGAEAIARAGVQGRATLGVRLDAQDVPAVLVVAVVAPEDVLVVAVVAVDARVAVMHVRPVLQDAPDVDLGALRIVRVVGLVVRVVVAVVAQVAAKDAGARVPVAARQAVLAVVLLPGSTDGGITWTY